MGSVVGESEVMPATNVQSSVPEQGGAIEPAPSAQLSEANTRSTIVWRILAIIIGALFVYAGAIKAMDPVEFAGDIQNYHVLPWAVNVRLAFYLPWLEMICGLALIFRRLYSGALSIVLGLMIVFIGATIAAKARGIDISCGCFGHVSDQLSFAWHLVLDFAILGAVATLWIRDRRNSSRSRAN
jgi:putative oxidoreductase